MRRVSDRADDASRERPPGGAAADGGRVPSRERADDHGGAAVLWVRARGPSGERPRVDRRQAGGQRDHRGGRGPRAGHGPAQRAVRGLL